jgi:hypothetical protein
MPACTILRHTFLTEAGECTDPFTLQYVAGHDNILRSPCGTYTRGRLQYMSCLRGWRTRNGRRNASGARSRCKIRFSWKYAQHELAKLLITGKLQSAEVVELADTPS